MKKFLLVFAVMLSAFSINSSAQKIWYRTFQFAYANVYDGIYDWGDWQSSDVKICIDFTNSQVAIYSPTTQYYQIVSTGDWESDGKGGKEIHMKFVDGDYDRGTMSLRIESNGNSQLYVRFSNVAWVYNLRKIS